MDDPEFRFDALHTNFQVSQATLYPAESGTHFVAQ